MKSIALLLVLAGSLLAAPWDGTRGPFTVTSFTNMASNLLPIASPALPAVPENTMILIRCSDPAVVAARVTITFRAGGVERTAAYFTDFYSGDGNGGIVTTIPRADILSVKVTELREGASY
jgi:hypothetical protein